MINLTFVPRKKKEYSIEYGVSLFRLPFKEWWIPRKHHAVLEIVSLFHKRIFGCFSQLYNSNYEMFFACQRHRLLFSSIPNPSAVRLSAKFVYYSNFFLKLIFMRFQREKMLFQKKKKNEGKQAYTDEKHMECKHLAGNTFN